MPSPVKDEHATTRSRKERAILENDMMHPGVMQDLPNVQGLNCGR